jgi:hypothetical protein
VDLDKISDIALREKAKNVKSGEVIASVDDITGALLGGKGLKTIKTSERGKIITN